jgi:hypothetical protein
MGFEIILLCLTMHLPSLSMHFALTMHFAWIGLNIRLGPYHVFFFFSLSLCAPILDVGLLTVVGVSYEVSIQSVHSQAISCSPTSRWTMNINERKGKP